MYEKIKLFYYINHCILELSEKYYYYCIIIVILHNNTRGSNNSLFTECQIFIIYHCLVCGAVILSFQHETNVYKRV